MGKLALCLYNCIEMAEILLALLAVSRYVYLEPVLKNRKAQFIYGTAFFVLHLLFRCFPEFGKIYRLQEFYFLVSIYF